MKKIALCILSLLASAFLIFQFTCMADFEDRNTNGISVYVDGQKIDFDVQPMVINNRTMVPMRKIFEALGAKVSWDQKNQTAIGETSDITIKFTIGQNYLSRTYNSNQESIKLDSPAVISSDRTLVPLRAIAESFSCDVNWIADKKVVDVKRYFTGEFTRGFIGKWKLIGYINDFEEMKYLNESFGTITFKDDCTVEFESNDGEILKSTYKIDEDGNAVINNQGSLTVGYISSDNSEIQLKEYQAIEMDDNVLWVLQQNHELENRIYFDDSLSYIEIGYGHILKRIY